MPFHFEYFTHSYGCKKLASLTHVLSLSVIFFFISHTIFLGFWFWSPRYYTQKCTLDAGNAHTAELAFAYVFLAEPGLVILCLHSTLINIGRIRHDKTTA
ncbi:hypothetical protein BCV70DRAFT_53908 [Testicularia cyperi]|uniref:Uncharacterized protein n=1 Tax=Testicularia cyperi TaxID=1882483 RepID=A0A317XV65_9BASI|nr:hypothetical protein BCV70DRAFT_53908 [Testicularia cyperi]